MYLITYTYGLAPSNTIQHHSSAPHISRIHTSSIPPPTRYILNTSQYTGSDDESDGEGKPAAPTKEDVYRACKKGTSASKKKKQAKLKRVMNSVRKASRTEEAAKKESFAALQLLHDPQVGGGVCVDCGLYFVYVALLWFLGADILLRTHALPPTHLHTHTHTHSPPHA